MVGRQSRALERVTIKSEKLSANLIGDPAERVVDVYVPEGETGEGLPLLVALAAYTSSGLALTGWKGFSENLPQRADRLIASGAMPPAVIACPDCFTALGGNQYINSPAMGPWADYLTQELLPTIEQKFGCGGPGRRGLFGKSSGGYGALTHGLLYPGTWAAIACHSGDIGFENCFLPDFPNVLRALAPFDSDVGAWLQDFFKTPSPSGHQTHVLMSLAMAASFDPVPDLPFGVRLPVDPYTCEIIPERWDNWLRWDPINLAENRHGQYEGPLAEHLSRLKLLYIDCGRNDQYNLLYGARRMHHALKRESVPHTYEEFDGTHSNIDHRLDVSLPLLARALT